jgi:hypothetical protein
VCSHRIQEAPKAVRYHQGRQTLAGNQYQKSKQAVNGIDNTGKKQPLYNKRNIHDGDYAPSDLVEPQSSDEELDMDAENELGILGFGKAVCHIFNIEATMPDTQYYEGKSRKPQGIRSIY